MSVTFYPHEDDLDVSSVQEKLEVLLDAAERYKSAVLDEGAKILGEEEPAEKSKKTPRDIKHAFQWQEIASLLKDVRKMSESTPESRKSKIDRLNKLIEIYEVLRGAKMPKLEGVRLALVNEVKQLQS